MKIILLTSLALIAFAANSVLCRLALNEGLIDAGGFTIVRLITGALMLWLLLGLQKGTGKKSSGSWQASTFLFLYAITFSYAYVSLDIGTGALILFGAGQVTLVGYAVWTGKRLSRYEGVGLLLALLGFVYLMLPNASAPSLVGFSLMSISGVAWAFYTIIGKSSKYALEDTASNFIRTLPMVLLLLFFAFPYLDYTNQGVFYAAVSGAIASGVGYMVWYMVVAKLETIHAAVVQLLVPVIAMVGGVLFISEPITTRLLLSSGLILGGILLVIYKHAKK